MNYIDNWLHFYETTESFEIHRNQGLINPDSICFLGETHQIYTQNTFFGICKERFERLEQLVLQHDAQIKGILGVEGPSVKDGIVNNIADLINFLDGFTDEDNLKDFLDIMKSGLESQISEVYRDLSDKVETIKESVVNDIENLNNIVNIIDTQIDGINTTLSAHGTAIATINTSLSSHIRDYNLLKTNYNNFKSYTESKFASVDTSISSINTSITSLQQQFTELNNKFADVDDEIASVEAILNEAKALIQELEDRFGDTLAEFEQFKRDVNNELDRFADLIGSPNGIAPLDSSSKIPSTYLPSYVDDVVEYATKGAFPLAGESGKIYVALDDNLTYRWSGSTYIEISKSISLGETSATAYPGNKGKKITDEFNTHKLDYDNPHRVTKTQLGLDRVDNTSDINKPVSTAQAEAINQVQANLDNFADSFTPISNEELNDILTI